MQNTSRLLMIRPVNFGFNAETAVNNAFQKNTGEDVQLKALSEFTFFVDLLRENKVEVTVIEDSVHPSTPDSIFPNNWISFHADGRVILYPMFAVNRRMERKATVLNVVQQLFSISEIIDLTAAEKDNLFLEGTGSMVLNREKNIAYACLSSRTDKELFNHFCSLLNYSGVTFRAADKSGFDIYHTNVMMCIAKTFAVVCLESVGNPLEKEVLINSIENTQKEIIEITIDQLNHFAGNMLQVQNEEGELLLVMSSQAYMSLTAEQIEKLEKHNRIIHSSLDHIETTGGGSARCMMAEIFLQKK
ncbi:MAG: amidinotransferase [Chitinophagaceae bacterium]|nr:amidinotransferase [Chitinophagaceae bacterium]